MAVHEDWSRFLADTAPGALHGAQPATLAAELRAARDDAFLCDLSGYALASASGADAEAFLQGQLSSDVKALLPTRAQLAAYNTPKGRMLATLLLWRSRDGFLLQFPGSLADAFVKRLAMFVLRSKVRITNASTQFVRMGVGGAKAADRLAACALPLPAADFELSRDFSADVAEERYIFRLPGNRFELVYSDVQSAMRDWRCIAAQTPIASAAPWRWLSVRSGIAEIETATQDKYVPQMVNLELVGGVSFTKGCYPGQEIVARTQYRGEIKRRTFLAHVRADAPPRLGEDVVAVSTAAQTVGSVVDSAPAPDGGYDILACLHLDLAHNAALHLGSEHGAVLEIEPMPYTLPQAL